MISLIEDYKKILDRIVLKIYPIETKFEFTNDDVSRFVMGVGEIKSDTFYAKGTFSALVNTGFCVSGKGVVIETPGVYFTEQKFSVIDGNMPGQLCYIDGCSNTNLVDPLRSGDPCLNYLYFPSGINQAYHTHPSLRIGFIVSGNGYASIDNKEIPLTAGSIFVLERHALHRFRTEDSHMSLMVFHPDSEDGPRDEFNPMKSRTYINGK
jgi:mannose-6-phosphate isomerase-like protein (cupin superfamily)